MHALLTLVIRVALTATALVVVTLVFFVEPVLVSDDAGTRTLVLLDRGRKTRVGDSVFCTLNTATPLRGRVAGVAGQRVSLKENLLFIDGEPVERRPCGGGETQGLSAAQASRCFRERRGDRSWRVVAPPDRTQVALDVRVPPGSLYVLSDDRAGHLPDSRSRGPVQRGSCRSVAAEWARGTFQLRP